MLEIVLVFGGSSLEDYLQKQKGNKKEKIMKYAHVYALFLMFVFTLPVKDKTKQISQKKISSLKQKNSYFRRT